MKLLPPDLTNAAASAWLSEIVPLTSTSSMQESVCEALRRARLSPALETRVAGGLFSADIALDYRGEKVVVEVCGPLHFVVPVTALETSGGGGGAGLGRVASSQEQPFGEALVVAAAGAATAAGAAAAAQSDPGAFFVVGAAGGRGAGGGGGLLQLGGGDVLRCRLLEALGWRVAHLPFHLWLLRGRDDQLLLAMLDHAVAADAGSVSAGSQSRFTSKSGPAPVVIGVGGRGGATGGGGRGGRGAASRGRTAGRGKAGPSSSSSRLPVGPTSKRAAAAAAHKVKYASQRAVESRIEARQLQQQQQAAAAGTAGSLAALLVGLEQGVEAGDAAFDQFDPDDLYLDPDALTDQFTE